MSLQEQSPVSESKNTLGTSANQTDSAPWSSELFPFDHDYISKFNPIIASAFDVQPVNALPPQNKHHSEIIKCQDAFGGVDCLSASLGTSIGTLKFPADDADHCKYSIRHFKNYKQIAMCLRDDSTVRIDPRDVCDNPLDAALVRLSLAQRAGYFPRKEQVYKRLINFCFKSLVKKFEEEVYPDAKVSRKRLKVEMIKRYFPADFEPFVVIKTKSNSRLVKEKSNFAYVNFNKAIMAKIHHCKSLKADLLAKINEVGDNPEPIFNKQLLKFLRECEKWLDSCPTGKPTENYLESLFTSKSAFAKKRSVNLPWTIDMTMRACRMTAEAIENASSE
jgi:hypothetical protein